MASRSTGDGNVLVWCSFTRNVERVDRRRCQGRPRHDGQAEPGPVARRLGDDRQAAPRHRPVPQRGSRQVSQRGALACATCHPDSRADGLSWRIDKHELQTPLLAGRVVGTHPYKWDGGDPTLRDSLTSTMKRLGGIGLDKPQTDSLAAYLECAPLGPHADPRHDRVARGKQLFDSEAGCAPATTARCTPTREAQARRRDPASRPTRRASSASRRARPYFHDGSAATLEALLRDRGAVHGMADTAKLTDQQVADLTAFLETL